MKIVLDWIMRARPQLTGLAIVLSASGLAAPGFFSIEVMDARLYGGLIDVLNRGAPVALLALGMCLVIATRGVDLSVGAVMAIAGACAAWAVNAELPWMIAVGAGISAGLICGLWNGVLVAVFRIQPIVATLILMVAGRGVAQLITEGRILTFIEPHLSAIGGGAIVGLPTPIIIVAVIAAVLITLMRATALGLFVEAVGVNPRASRLSGIDDRFALISVYAISGFTAAVAGLIVAADIRGADANNGGLWLELDAILAAVIGGASLYGGRFSLSLALMGAYILQTVKTGILRSGVAPEFNLLAMAAVVAILLVLQSPAVSAAWARMRKAKPA